MPNLLHLPMELVLHTMACLLPDKDVLLSPWHPTMRTLLSFTPVCQETRRTALRYLRPHCVYLYSEARLRRFLVSDTIVKPSSTDSHGVTALYLSLHTPSLHAVSLVHKLFSLIGPSLKRLATSVLLIENPWDEDPERPIITQCPRECLREALRNLKGLEEFITLSGGLDLPDSPVWRSLQRIQKLALPYTLADDSFWRDVALLPELSTVVLISSDSFHPSWTPLDAPKTEFFRHADRKIKVLLVYLKNWRRR